jgi:uncharacterized membrane protein
MAAVRTVLVFVLSLAVQGAALSAPLLHAHPDDHATAHHQGRAVHTHWASHAESLPDSNWPVVGTEDHDRAVFLGTVVAVAVSSWSVPATTVTAFALPVLAERPARRGIEVVRSHDPPYIRSLSTRAPPSFLS